MPYVGKDFGRFQYWDLATWFLRESADPAWERVRTAVTDHGVRNLLRTAVVHIGDGTGEAVDVLGLDREVLTLRQQFSVDRESKLHAQRITPEHYPRYGPNHESNLAHASEWVSRPVKYVQHLTNWMRASQLRRWVTLREAIQAEGIDPSTGAVAELGLDQHSLDGIFVGEDRRIFEFDMWLPVDDPTYKTDREVAENAYVERLVPAGDGSQGEAEFAYWFLDIEAGTTSSWPLEWFVGSRDQAFSDW